MIGSGESAVWNTVAVHILVACESAEAIKIFLAQNFSALDRLFRVFERIRHPVVHAKIKIGHHEHQCLELLRQLKRILGHAETLLRGTRNKQDVLGVAVGEKCGGKDVALRGARRQASRRANTLDVPDDAWNFGVISQPRELGH